MIGSALVPLVGRAAELAVLDSALATARSGRTEVVLLTGPAGIGKSRLIEHLHEAAAALGVHVVAASGDALEHDRPFGLLRRALPLEGQLGVGGMAPAVIGTPMSSAGRAADALVDGLGDLLAEGPVALLLDDVHWADRPTLLALGAVVARLAGHPLLVALAARPVSEHPDLAFLIDVLVAQGAHHLDLQPLAEDEALDLAVAISGRPATALAAPVAIAKGVPLFVVDLALADEPGPSLAGREAAVARRLAGLGDEAIGLARVAAVLGLASLDELAAAAGMAPEWTSDLVQQLVRHRVLTVEGTSVGFEHDLLAEGLYGQLAVAIRNAMHRDCAAALAALGARPERVAHHAALGAQRGDGEAVGWLLDAAAAVRSTGPEQAVGWLRRARELALENDPRRREVEIALATTLAWAGSIVEADELTSALLARTTDADQLLALHSARTEARIMQGRYAEAGSDLEAAAALPGLGQATRDRLQAEAALARLMGGDLAGADELAAAVTDESNDRPARTLALSVRAWAANLGGRLEASMDLARQAVETAGDEPDAHWFHPYLFLAVALIDADLLDEAADALREGQQWGNRLGTVWDQSVYQFVLGLCRYCQGRWDDAAAELRAGFDAARDNGTALAVVWAAAVTMLIAVERDDLPAAHEAEADAEREIAAKGPVQVGVDWLLWAEAKVAAAEGDERRALELLDLSWTIDIDTGIRSELPRTGPDVVRAYLDAGRQPDADTAAAAVEALAVTSPTTSAMAAARLCRGLVDGDPGVVAGAVELARSGPRRHEHARACELAAPVLAAAGDRDGAVALLGEALELYEQLGAARAVARSTAALRELGVRRGRRGSRPRATVGWASLSETERRVADLVTQGLTNRAIAERLFVSPRTVETHVAHVFAKLGVSSRAAIADHAVGVPA